MSQARQQFTQVQRGNSGSSLQEWLRMSMKSRTAAIVASLGAAAICAAALLPGGRVLSAAQLAAASGSSNSSSFDSMPPQRTPTEHSDSSIEIAPRGAVSPCSSVPVRTVSLPASTPAHSEPIRHDRTSPRGILRPPVFAPAADAATTVHQDQPQPRHAGMQPSRNTRPVYSGLNSVDASGVASLPHAAAAAYDPPVVAAMPRRASGSDSGRPTMQPAGMQSPEADSSDGGPPQLTFSPRNEAADAAIVNSPLGRPAPGTSGFRATVESDANGWISPYLGRTGMLPHGVETSPTPVPSVSIPPGFSAWWDSLVQQRAGIAPRSIAVDVTTLVQQALIYSPQVQVLQADPEIQQRIVKQEEATFDWRSFLNSRYDDLNDPIGNTLTTGNNDNRFTDRHTLSTGGLKRRTTAGGEVRVAQQFGYQDNNSRFLLPNPQSTSRLELSFRQPLLSQSGTVYNQSQIFLARINASSSGDETLEALQKHLYGVAEAYWTLYRARAEFFQRQKFLKSAQAALLTLEARNEVDTIPRQILRARAAVARAESRMQRAVTDIRNSESQLRLLVNDPEMLNGGPVEFTPSEMPSMVESATGLRQSLQESLVNRPDISYAIRQMRASGVRMGVSKSEMLPKLDFIVSSYVAGLENKTQFVDSFNNQFTQGRPGYGVGLEFEVPLGNRAARARVEQRQWELKRAINSFRATVETSLTEVEIASREVDTSWRELLGKYQAMVAAQNEVSYLQDRFDVLPMAEESSILLLEDLLDGYERLADEEAAFAEAQTTYALSILQLRRATGTMLRSRYDEPELEGSESEWMTSRAEQAASDIKSRDVPSAKLTRDDELSLPTEAKSNQLPVTWTSPIKETPPPHRSSKPTTKIGGHSFGSEN